MNDMAQARNTIRHSAICITLSPRRKTRRRPSDAIELNGTVQSRLLVCGGLQLVRDDRELFLFRFKFRIAVQSRRLVCAVLQLARNKLFICNRYSQSKCRGMSPDAKYVCIITLGGTF